MPVPMYRQIAEDLKRKIEAEELPQGSQLSTEAELMEQYGASRNTVRDAIKWLATRGLIETRPGQGTFVVETPPPLVITLTGDPATGDSFIYDTEVQERRRTSKRDDPVVEIQSATGFKAAALQVPERSTLVSRHLKLYIDETPWCLQTSFYPMSLVERGATRLLEKSDIEEGAVKYFTEALDITQVGYRDQIRVRPPDDNEAAFFGLPEDGRISVFSIMRTAFDQHGKPVRLTHSIYPADRIHFAVNVGDVPAAVRETGHAAVRETSHADRAADPPAA